MNKIAKALLAGGAVIVAMAGPSRAADLVPATYIEPVPIYGLYLRGFVGASNQRLGNLDNALFHVGGIVQFVEKGKFDAAPFFGGGIGWRFNEWFRIDFTGEYRADADFYAFDRYDFNSDGIWDGTNAYSGRKSEALFLANVFFDLGTWYSLTPYVGAGIGTSRNTITGFTDINAPNGAIAYADSSPNWDLAWALYAGIAWNITPAFAVELGYRYVDLGNAQTGDLVGFNGANMFYNPMYFNDITSHDVMLGVRYNFL